jgi:hypothetical protein
MASPLGRRARPYVEALACRLLASSPPEPQLMLAAREAADAILHLRRVQEARRSLLDAAVRSNFEMTGVADLLDVEGYLEDVLRDPRDPIGSFFAVRLAMHVSGEALKDRGPPMALAAVLAGRSRELRQLEEYERRALSRRGKTLRCLDYVRIETERRRAST